MTETEIEKRVLALVQTDDRTEENVLSARRYHARSFIAWDHNERDLLKMLIQIGFSKETLSKTLKRSVNAVEREQQKLINDAGSNEIYLMEIKMRHLAFDIIPPLND